MDHAWFVRLERWTQRLRPEVSSASGEAVPRAALDTLGVIYAAPLVVIGLVWLVTATDVKLIAREAAPAADCGHGLAVRAPGPAASYRSST